MSLKKLYVMIFIVSSVFASGSAQTHPKGLYVRDGIVMHNGEQYRAMGINYYQFFNDLLRDSENRNFVEGFKILKQDYNVPFVRFMACPYNHQIWKSYLDKPDEFFSKMDIIVAEAEKQKIGLIPSLFWQIVTVPDMMDEPLSALGDPNSKTRRFIRKHTEEFVSRYKDSPAIYGWEVGNEYMLFADLPKYDHLPPKKLGSDQPRTEKDKILHGMVIGVYEDFYKAVRKIDKDRIILTGDSLARAHVWNNHHEDRWEKDTRKQWFEMFKASTPDCYEVVTFHLYKSADGNYFKDENLPMEQLIAAIVSQCRKDKKAIWCGELGMPGRGEDVEKMFSRMMKVVEANKISISAIWNFTPTGSVQQDWDISPEGDRSYMLDAVKELNDRFAIGDWK